MKSNLSSSLLTSTSRFWLIYLFLSFTILLAATGNGQELTGKTFIVAPGGSDNNPGTMLQPLATLDAARDAARMVKPGNNRIIVMPGEYFLARPFVLDSRDNGLTIEADTSGKVILYGGTLVTGWQRDGEKFWFADLPDVKKGTWDFRALVINGRLPERARLPESGTFTHQQSWDVRVLPAIAGYWERQPTPEEKLIMAYDPKDIPETFDVKNAEVRVYHMWDESFVGVASNDFQRHVLIFSSPTIYPPGAFGVKKYVIWNTLEGMTKPGRWYLDRTAGRLVYWPLNGEDMKVAKVYAPKIEQIIRIAGEPDKKAENITIRGLTLQATTIPLKSAGFGGSGFDGALSMINTHKCTLEEIEISNVGGLGISATQMTVCRITDCHVHNTGACGVKINGTDIFFARNHIHDVGLYYPSSAAFYAGGSRNHIYRNEIHDAPYSGMIIGKSELLAEENLIYRVMREIHDGAAMYASGGNNIIMRGNVVRDITESGSGYGVSSYYLDEGAYDCIVEQNVSIGVARPVHNHIARNSIIRDNFFITDEDMTLSFQSSAKFTFERNTLITPGKISITSPNAVTKWKDNKIFSNGLDNNKMPQAFTIDSAMPYIPIPSPKTRPIEVMRSIKAPTLDGDLATDEWAGEYQRLDREPSRQAYSGAPVLVKFSWDNQFLYIGALMSMFDISNISLGDTWGKDDGVEISIRGFTDKNEPETFVIRTYVNGTVKSITDAGANTLAAERLGKEVRFVSKIMEKPKKGWIGEWAIPLDALGLKPEPDTKVAFNMCAFINEFDNWHCWEGTLGESWQVDQAGILQFK